LEKQDGLLVKMIVSQDWYGFKSGSGKYTKYEILILDNTLPNNFNIYWFSATYFYPKGVCTSVFVSMLHTETYLYFKSILMLTICINMCDTILLK
jgi:hypothetical protein